MKVRIRKQHLRTTLGTPLSTPMVVGGQGRIPIDVLFMSSTGIRLVTSPAMRDWLVAHQLNPNEALACLPPWDGQPNHQLTPGAVKYLANSRLVLEEASEFGRRIVRPVKILTLETANAIPGFLPTPEERKKGVRPGFTHSHDLRHGRYCTVNLLDGMKEELDPMKGGKRIKLMTGWRVVGHQPLPSSVAIADSKKARIPDGIVLVSQKYAGSYRLHTNASNHDVGRIVRAHLENGDKLAGTLPNGLVIKGSARVIPNLAIRVDGNVHLVDMVVPTDAIKLKGMPLSGETRIWVKSRAAERYSDFGRTLSYQAGQFIPYWLRQRVLDSLDSPLYTEEEVRKARLATSSLFFEVHTENDSLTPREILELVASRTWTPRLRDAMIFLFTWQERDNDGNEVQRRKYWANRMDKGLVPWSQDPDAGRLLNAIRRELRKLLDKFLNPPVIGACGVLMPLGWEDDRDTISIPFMKWVALGKPTEVMATRYPIKGKSSLVRLRVTTHRNGMDIRCHPEVVDLCWNGDFDGDLVFIHVDEDLVESAMTVGASLALSRRAREEVKPIGLQLAGLPEEPALIQVLIAEWRSAIALATTWRDNTLQLGADEEQCLRCFEALSQPALAQMDGGEPVATYLLEHKDRLVTVTGLPHNWREMEHWPTPIVREMTNSSSRRYKVTLSSLKRMAVQCSELVKLGEGGNHAIILSAFASMEVDDTEGGGPIG